MFAFSHYIDKFFENIEELRPEEVKETLSKLNQGIRKYKELGVIATWLSYTKMSPDGKDCIFTVLWYNNTEYGRAVTADLLEHTVRIVDNSETCEKVRGVLF